MNKKRIFFLIPAAILPYLILFTLAVIFFSTTRPFFERIIDSLPLFCVLCALLPVFATSGTPCL